MSTEAQAEASRRNGAQSHGPVTEEGKANSCMNRFRHGFCAEFSVLGSEDQYEFDTLLLAFRMDHQPQTPTEHLLVDQLAQHYWLSRRAQKLQDSALEEQNDKSFALYLRYQTTNDRAFSKCLSDLLKLRSERRKQVHQQKENQRKQETHEARVRSVNAKAEEQEIENSMRETVETYLPGHTQIPFRLLKGVLANAMEQFARELDANPELAKSLKAA